MSQQQKRRMYSHYERYADDIDEDFWPMMGVLCTIWAIWTAVIHFLDWLSFDVLPWWSEPLTIIPFIFLLIMHENFDSLNPLHWWPMFWGYKAKLPDEDKITIRPLDTERIMEQHGGKLNVYIIDYESVKFRRKKDAVIFALRNL